MSSEFLYHSNCESCGSSDANSVFDDGHTFCFSCRSHGKATEGTQQVETSRPSDLITGGDIKPFRGISAKACEKYNYRITKNGAGDTVHLAPYYNEAGHLVAQHLRYESDKNKMPWKGNAKEASFFGINKISKSGKKLYICEGEVDTMSVSDAMNNSWDVIGVAGAQSLKGLIKKNIEWIDKYDEVIIFFDGDDAGRDSAKEAADIITAGKCKIVNCPEGKDANDILVTEGSKAVMKLIWDAPVHRPDGIVAGSDLKDKMEDWYNGTGRAKSYSLGRPRLDDRIRGFRKKEIITLIAGTGIGKSTEAFEYASHLVEEHGLRVGIVALEEDNVESGLRLMSIDSNIPIHLLPVDEQDRPIGISKEDFMSSYKRTVGSGSYYFYDHFGAVDSENLMSKLRYLAVGCDVDCIILDHITIAISLEDNQNQAADFLMNSLKSLVEATGVGIIAVAHLRKTATGGKSFEEGAQISLDNIKGSGSLKQIPNTIIAYERDQQSDDPYVTKLRVLKCRYTGQTGEAGHTKFNKDTGRLENHTVSTDCPVMPPFPMDGDDVPF